MKRFTLAAAVTAAIMAPAAAQAATTIKITNYAFPVGSQTGTLHYAGSPFNNGGVRAGEFKLTGTNLTTGSAASFLTYCVDIFHALTVPGTYTITPLSTLFTGAKATNINKLLANTNPATADQSAAVQLAMWEIVNETGPIFNVNSGANQGAFWMTGGSSAAARTLANNYLANLGSWSVSTTHTAQLLYSRTNQSQVFLTPVPEPGTWAMMVFGFMLVGATVRLRKPIYATAV
jgi:PEP-CTERM motif